MEGLVPWGSNYTFLVHVCGELEQVGAIYKPSKGERPLWDFASGTLSKRERAAFLVSEAIQWDLVPPTILRDGPHGWGSLQYFVEHNSQQHYLTLQGDYKEQVKRIALFDVLINNADRKSGHVIVDNSDRLWAIDHGLCFHSENKLRSVIWEFAGEPLPESLLSDLLSLLSLLSNSEGLIRQELGTLLSSLEMEALGSRLNGLIENRKFPAPGPGRHYPWPLI
ncbi:MAG TPA: SCO1664 family protein [candidate division Zixibacteria bacterium]|nr:SCO1664 family protein [candidate division Zixibacteria bacterium]